MTDIASIDGLKEWLRAKLPPEATEGLDLSKIELRPETVARIGKGTEGFIGRVLEGEWKAGKNPNSLLAALNNLLTCRTHFRYLEEILKVSRTNSLSEAFKRFTVIVPSSQPTGDTVVIASSGQRIKEGYYQVFNKTNPSLGTLFFGKKAFVHLYELFAGEGALSEKSEKAKAREKSYDASLKEVLLGVRESSHEGGGAKESWLIKERQEFLTKLRVEVEVAKAVLDKLGYVPSGIFPEADRALLENDAGCGLLGWIKREKDNLPPHAKEALDLLLDKFIDLEKEDREFLLHSVFAISQAMRYIDKHFALSDINSDMDAYLSERGSIPPSFSPLVQLLKSETKIITQLELQLIGNSGIIEYRRERNEELLGQRREELSAVLEELSPLFKDESGRLFDDVLVRGIPGRLKSHLYFKPLFRGETVVSKDEFFALREMAQYFRNGQFSWHLVGTYSIHAFREMADAATLASRKIKYLEAVLKENRLTNSPKDPPPDEVLALRGELLTGNPSLTEIDGPLSELLARYRGRRDLSPRFPDSASKLRALGCGLREESFTDEEFRLFTRTMKELVPRTAVGPDLADAAWLLSRKLVSDDSFLDFPPADAPFLSLEEARRVRSLATYARIRKKLYPSFASEESNEAEEVLRKKRAEFATGAFIVHKIRQKDFVVEKHDLNSLSQAKSLSGGEGRFAGLGWREGIGGISYLDPQLLERDLRRVENDFERLDPPYYESSAFNTLKRVANSLGLSRLSALGYKVDKDLWKQIPSARHSTPLFIGRELLRFIDEILKKESRAINQHFAVGGDKVNFTFSKEYEGKDLFDVASESPEKLKSFAAWMRKQKFPDSSCEVVEKALEENITREALYEFAWGRGTEELVDATKRS